MLPWRLSHRRVVSVHPLVSPFQILMDQVTHILRERPIGGARMCLRPVQEILRNRDGGGHKISLGIHVLGVWRLGFARYSLTVRRRAPVHTLPAASDVAPAFDARTTARRRTRSQGPDASAHRTAEPPTACPTIHDCTCTVGGPCVISRNSRTQCPAIVIRITTVCYTQMPPIMREPAAFSRHPAASHSPQHAIRTASIQLVVCTAPPAATPG